MTDSWGELQALVAKLTKVAAIAQTVCDDYETWGEIFAATIDRLEEALEGLKNETR